MKSIQLYKEVEVIVKELQSNAPSLHKHHFFELIYVLEGSGVHVINENNYAFSKGDVFLLTPEDVHTFQIAAHTRFCIVDFTKSFFSTDVGKHEEKMNVSDLFKRLEYIFHNHHNVKGNVISATDKDLFGLLVAQLIAEKENNQFFKEVITQNIVFLLLNLLARNIQQNIAKDIKRQNPKNKIYEIIAYVQQNIYNKELIKIENIAVRFNKSSDHMSRYFKAQTGSTLKDYINRYKLNLVGTRLKFSDLTISEIAEEMNFTDESHLNKVFKKVLGKTPRQFRMDYLNSC